MPMRWNSEFEIATQRSAASRPTRHLPDRILAAAHEACDLGALDVAGSLLRILEAVVTGMRQNSPTAQRRSMEGLVAAHGRVWHLRHHHRLVLEDPAAALR
ncbi:MAG: hypothetical protein INR65_08865 [Gluconacetobacter diazotrophicus]|nr:hypothetical protein [Gluconacetobacter diazotrophicus]